MSDLFGPFEAVEGAIETAVPRNLLGSAISQGLNQGLGATEMLRAYRAAGGAIRTQSWYQLVGEVREATARAGDIGGLPLDQLPAEGSIVEWSGGRAGTYLYRMNVYVRENVEGVGLNVVQQMWDIQTSELLTPEQAIANITDQFGQTESQYATVMLGASVRGIYRQTGTAGR